MPSLSPSFRFRAWMMKHVYKRKERRKTSTHLFSGFTSAVLVPYLSWSFLVSSSYPCCRSSPLDAEYLKGRRPWLSTLVLPWYRNIEHLWRDRHFRFHLGPTHYNVTLNSLTHSLTEIINLMEFILMTDMISITVIADRRTLLFSSKFKHHLQRPVQSRNNLCHRPATKEQQESTD